MTGGDQAAVSWADRAAERSPAVQRSRTRSVQQMTVIVAAAERLILQRGSGFTTQELAKEAGVAMQTFYRYFAGKDQLILPVIEDMVTVRAAELAEAVRDLPDPLARLRHHVVATLSAIDADAPAAAGPRFITAEHWRLLQLFPAEVTRAQQPFIDLVATELRAAQQAGLLRPGKDDRAVDRDAALVARLVMSTFHHHAFTATDQSAEEIGEHVWEFCLTGLGGTAG